MSKEETMYYNKGIEEVEKELKTSSKGLTSKEVAKREEKYGLNVEKIVNKILKKQVKNPILY